MRILCNNCISFAVQCRVQTESLPRNADAEQKHSHNHIGNYFCEPPHGFEHGLYISMPHGFEHSLYINIAYRLCFEHEPQSLCLL